MDRHDEQAERGKVATFWAGMAETVPRTVGVFWVLGWPSPGVAGPDGEAEMGVFSGFGRGWLKPSPELWVFSGFWAGPGQAWLAQTPKQKSECFLRFGREWLTPCPDLWVFSWFWAGPRQEWPAQTAKLKSECFLGLGVDG